MPPPESQFMIIGLTNGPAFTPNPCLTSQVAYARDRGQWTAGYAVSSFPTDSQLAQYGGGGTRQQQLYATGVAQARFNVANLRAAGLRTTVLWVDIEPVSSAPWSANAGENNAVIDGVLRATPKQDCGPGGTPTRARGTPSRRDGVRPCPPGCRQVGRTATGRSASALSRRSRAGQ